MAIFEWVPCCGAMQSGSPPTTPDYGIPPANELLGQEGQACGDLRPPNKSAYGGQAGGKLRYEETGPQIVVWGLRCAAAGGLKMWVFRF